MPTDIAGLPGAELVRDGLRDQRDGATTIAQLVVSLVGTRLRGAGLMLDVPVESAAGDAEHALYRALEADPTVSDPYYRYNSLKRELDSFLAALEARQRRARLGD